MEVAALGFRWLAILDLSSTAHQTMATVDGRYFVIYNGEVYNFRQFRRDLGQRGVAFRSSGHTEVVLHCLALWARAALERFNGRLPWLLTMPPGYCFPEIMLELHLFFSLLTPMV